jgi:phosphoenolpyruvate carboxylase
MTGAEAADGALRADVRRVSTLLGHSLVRQEGPELLDLVEQVRTLTRSDPAAAADLLRAVDEATAARLVRAFNTYFHLANVVEQVHRGRELRRRRALDGGWLQRTADLIAERDVAPAELTTLASRLAVQPVFTAHPTEAARRSTLTKLRAVADALDTEAAELALAPGEGVVDRTDRRLAEVIDLLWLTDELRQARPEPVDEARNAVFHLEDAARSAVPAVLADLAVVFARFGVELPITARPLRFGTWTGGDRDGNPNVTPAVTMQVLTLQHEQGIRVVERSLAALVEELSVSSRVGGASADLLASLAEDLERLPEVDARFRRINAEEPYRLKISCIRAKLARTRRRLAAVAAGTASRHDPGRDYLGAAGLVADLELLRRSLAEHHGELIANGR